MLSTEHVCVYSLMHEVGTMPIVQKEISLPTIYRNYILLDRSEKPLMRKHGSRRIGIKLGHGCSQLC